MNYELLNPMTRTNQSNSHNWNFHPITGYSSFPCFALINIFAHFPLPPLSPYISLAKPVTGIHSPPIYDEKFLKAEKQKQKKRKLVLLFALRFLGVSVDSSSEF